FPEITDEEVEAATYGHDSRDLPDRDRAADVAAGDRVLAERISGIDVARELDRGGFTEVAEAVLGMQRQRVSADYLQTSAIIDRTGEVSAAINDPNRYAGPGSGYRLEGERSQLMEHLPHELDALLLDALHEGRQAIVGENGSARTGSGADAVVIDAA